MVLMVCEAFTPARPYCANGVQGSCTNKAQWCLRLLPQQDLMVLMVCSALAYPRPQCVDGVQAHPRANDADDVLRLLHIQWPIVLMVFETPACARANDVDDVGASHTSKAQSC